ncbi:MAG: hypothetical protein WAV00_16535 [Nocardioides sp.]
MTLRTRQVYDDPWILYRYANNLASGNGWSFNPGVSEANAVTSPLMVLLIAALIKASFSALTASSLLFLIGMWAAAHFAFLTFRLAGKSIAGAIAAALILSSPWLTALRGMESALLLGATSIALWAMMADRSWVTGVALGVAILARPDAIVLTAFSLAILTSRRRMLPWRELSALVAVVLPWLVYSQLAFHSLLPSTLAAKQAQRDSGYPWAGLTRTFVSMTVMHGSAGTFLICAALASGGLVIMIWCERQPWPLVPLVMASAASFILYEFVLGIAGYPWYAATVIYSSFLLIALTLDFVARQSFRLRIGVLAVAVGLVIAGLSNPYQMPSERRDEATVARWLRGHAKPHSTVAGAEIGQLGFVSRMRVVDYLGLLDPRADSHIRRGDWDWWVAADHPDYWVTSRSHSFPPDALVLKSQSFKDNYQMVYETAHLEVYARM